MEPEERLNHLLSQRGEVSANHASAPGERFPMESEQSNAGGSDELDSLLHVADRFAVWGTAEPSSAFAQQLEAKLITRFATPSSDAVPNALIAVPPREDAQHTGPPREAVGPASAPAAAGTRRRQGKGHFRGIHIGSLRWQAVAAVLLIGIVASALAAAIAGARPGQPFYAVVRFGQGVRTDLASRPEERARLHLTYAQDALAAFDAAISQQSGDQAYRDTLTALVDEERAAGGEISHLPAGATRDELSTQLETMLQSGRRDLHAALLALNWPMRVEVTGALGQLGDLVPTSASSSVAGVTVGDAYVWILTVHGSGFQRGAILLVDAKPMGMVTSDSATTLVAQIGAAELNPGAHQIGVGNPDGTAVLVGTVTIVVPDDHGHHGGSGSPTPQGTPGSDDHHGGSSSGGGSGDGGGSGGY